MNQVASIITHCVCIVTLITASNLTVLANQKRTVQRKFAQQASSDEIVDKLKRATQEMLDAVARGDKTVWDRHLAAGSIYADEEGRILTKAELLNELRPLPPNYQGSIKIEETKALVQENVVVLSHVDHEELVLYGQKLSTNFLTTQTWAKQQDGEWRVVSTQVMALPNERKPAVIDVKKLDEYVGQYEVEPRLFTRLRVKVTRYLGSEPCKPGKSYFRFAWTSSIAKAVGAVKKCFKEMLREELSQC